ncbi:flagella basal body P-ring formation protein FlgA [Sphingomonas sp. CFBP 13720]|uniref:flagella basal body P-ring formation protein FlgA n=1 Tax=Sphingomonas sp. CFBP 13720 TaxID=2775302 RepID=UPI001782110C|nr:flagella basal body P-ring formation protein FlgA [Sphingomonas sp. CFBP 13720]MBD8677836.1 flagella basal body P-ring formation protein FlgA [Sphingomonas sp. CFBP 13720]
MIRPLILSLVLATSAAAQGFQSTAQLDRAVAQFTGAAIGTEGGAQMPVDSRLRLASCAMPQFGWLSDRQDAVVIHCMAPVWKLYVPIRRAVPRAVVASAAVPAAVTAAPAKPVPVIRRGDPIMVEAGAAGFAITREGTAMGDAPAGGRLLVRVDPAKPPIQAVAVEAGRAMLPGFER